MEYPSVQHIGSTQGAHVFRAQKISVQHQIPSVQHQNPSVPYQKFLRSTPNTPYFNTPLSSTPKPSQFHTKNHSVPYTPRSTPKTPQLGLGWGVFSVEHRGVWNWGVVGVELRGGGGGCGTEEFLVLNWGVCNWGVLGVELRVFFRWTEGFWGWKGVALLCRTDVLNWGRCETDGDPYKCLIVVINWF